MFTNSLYASWLFGKQDSNHKTRLFFHTCACQAARRQAQHTTNVLTLSDMIPIGLLGLPRATSSDWWKQIFKLFWTVCNRKFYRCESVAGIYIGGNSPVKWLINCWDCSLLFKAKLKQAQTVFGGILQKKASNEREEII